MIRHNLPAYQLYLGIEAAYLPQCLVNTLPNRAQGDMREVAALLWSIDPTCQSAQYRFSPFHSQSYHINTSFCVVVLVHAALHCRLFLALMYRLLLAHRFRIRNLRTCHAAKVCNSAHTSKRQQKKVHKDFSFTIPGKFF